MRPSEMPAQGWTHIDFREGYARVSKAQSKGRLNDRTEVPCTGYIAQEKAMDIQQLKLLAGRVRDLLQQSSHSIGHSQKPVSSRYCSITSSVPFPANCGLML
jgi:hypothetical protein